MPVSKDEDKRFLSQYASSEAQFVREYRQRYYGKPNSKELLLLVLYELENAIVKGKIDIFKRFIKIFEFINNVENSTTLKAYLNDPENPFKSTNLIILCCKHNRVEILKYMFDNSSILDNLSVDVDDVIPDREDEYHHTAFYYAIRSNNTELVDILIEKWPFDYFTTRSEELDRVLSRAYEELKWKNVDLSESMEIFVENKLLNLRFFSNRSGKSQVSVRDRINNIRERIDLVLEKIDFLKSEYSNVENVDEKFLFVTRFIAKNIHVLKRQLRVTYDRLPWEEIEFCLISFVSSHLKNRDVNLFYRTVLNKSKLLQYLDIFTKKLETEKHNIKISDISRLGDLPKVKRDLAVQLIIRNHPEFKELYNDYQRIRDIHSLEIINDYLNLALSCDPNEKEGKLIITRALQVIGEYLKNTLESPKLSSSTSDLLLMSLPKNTRKIITDLRNSLSHSYSLSKRIEIEENADNNFFIGVQKDIKRIYDVITKILFNNKMKMVGNLLQSIVDHVDMNELKNIAELLKNVQFEETSYDFKFIELETLEKLVKEMNDAITEKNDFEEGKFAEINEMIQSGRSKSDYIKSDYKMRYKILKGFAEFSNDDHRDQHVIRILKWSAKMMLTMIRPQEKVSIYNLRKIAEYSMDIYHSAESRLHGDKLDELMRSACEIFCIAESEISDIQWIEKMRERLFNQSSFISFYNQPTTCNVNVNKYKTQLSTKLSDLEAIMKNNEVSCKSVEKLPSYKTNKKLQVVLEMLVLDIMSILGECEKHLENNLLFLDDNSPLLTGKCLRNHLAHGNTIVDVLLSDPSVAIILNAEKLSNENNNIVQSNKKVGKLVEDEPAKLKDKFNQCFIIITTQEKMFAALEAGNLEELQICLAEGADINARNIDSWTALHFASHGPSLEVVKFVLNQNLDAKATDSKGQLPLHVAAASGRKNIVEFFITKARVPADCRDTKGQTSLHMAAKYGHKDVVEALLKNNPSIGSINDEEGHTPLHCAVQNNQVEVAKVLVQKADINDEGVNGSTFLHTAAQFGCLEMVNFLLSCDANVGARRDNGETPLHQAALNGHPEILKALILKGADVNATTSDGFTPLHYAAEQGHREVTDILLENRANVNATVDLQDLTPLHVAAQNKREEIVDTLLKHKANPSCATVPEGLTPLHFAVWTGSVKIIEFLIKHGADVHARNINRCTPLHHAAEAGQKEIAEILIRSGADINSKATKDITPIHVAAVKGKEAIAEMLISKKAKLYVKDVEGKTPIFAAVQGGNLAICELLVKNKADVNIKDRSGYTPLHIAAQCGHADVVAFLLENKAEVNAKGGLGTMTSLEALEVANSPLHLAISEGHKEVVDILVANKADVNSKSQCTTPLLAAIKRNQKEIVETLIAYGANVNADNGEPLLTAVANNRKDIVDMLIQKNARIDVKDTQNLTLLHFAAKMGYEELVSVLISRGIKVDALTAERATPLHVAAQEGNVEVAKILISKGADIDAVSSCSGTPLHVAAGCNHVNFVKLLFEKGAKINIRDQWQRSALDLAVILGKLPVVKVFLQNKRVNKNAKGKDNLTILHIAIKECNFEMIKYLVDNGCDINAVDKFGLKPVHHAAGEGRMDVVELFLANGIDINDPKEADVLLYSAIAREKLEMVKYLVSKGVDINRKDEDGTAPIFHATMYGHKEIILFLLENGAVYNPTNSISLKPSSIVDDPTCNPIDQLTKEGLEVSILFKSTDALFEAVKQKNAANVRKYIKSGAFVNAKNADIETTPLHYAAWKGCHEVVNVLLENKAKPNAFCSKGFTPLHYASKFSHYDCVKALLHHGAIYNAAQNGGKPPSNYASDKNIISLLKLIDDSFRKVKNGNVRIIHELNQVKDFDILNAVMNASNEENKTLIAAAPQNDSGFIESLKSVAQGDVNSQINEALAYLNRCDFQKGLDILKRLFERRKQILGADNLATLDIQAYLAKGLFRQGNYQAALKMFDEIFEKQKKMLGFDNKSTLDTRCEMALVLYTSSKSEEALKIFREVYQKQKEILGSDHPDTENTQFNIALALEKLGKFDEALRIFKSIFTSRKAMFGADHISTIQTRNNIAMVLCGQGKYEESLRIYKDVLEKKKKVMGATHGDTLRTMGHIAGVLFKQNKYLESSKMFQEVIDLQKKTLPPNHPEISTNQYNLANVLLAHGKLIAALKIYKECFDQRLAVFGPNDPTVIDIAHKIKKINEHPSQAFQQLQTNIHAASSKGDMQKVKLSLMNGIDVDEKDTDGRTALHYAVNNERVNIINILLENDADVTHATNKGNTPLHTATSKNNLEIVEILLKKVNRDKLNDFVNAKTASSGTTSLHVAAKNGCLSIVKSLLKRGAIYDVTNKEGKKPIDLCTDQKTIELLKSIDDLFQVVKKGSVEAVNKLKTMKPDEFSAATSARNTQGRGLLQVAILNKQKDIASVLLEMLKKTQP